jgi:hypothetical protein
MPFVKIAKIKGCRPLFINMNWHHEKYRFTPPQEIGKYLGGAVKQNFTQNSAVFQNACAIRLSYALNKCNFYIPQDNPFPGSSFFCSEKWEVISDATDLEILFEPRNLPFCWSPPLNEEISAVDRAFGKHVERKKNIVTISPPQFRESFSCNIASEPLNRYYIFRQKLMKFYLELIFGKACVAIDKATASLGIKIDWDLITQHIGGKRGIIIYEFPHISATGHCDLWDRDKIAGRLPTSGSFPEGISKFLFWELP